MQEEPDRGLLEVPEIDRWPGNEPVSDSHDEQAVDAPRRYCARGYAKGSGPDRVWGTDPQQSAYDRHDHRPVEAEMGGCEDEHPIGRKDVNFARRRPAADGRKANTLRDISRLVTSKADIAKAIEIFEAIVRKLRLPRSTFGSLAHHRLLKTLCDRRRMNMLVPISSCEVLSSHQ